jgi:DNA-binding MarR family transcriptional regulator
VKKDDMFPEEDRSQLAHNILRGLRIVFRTVQNHSRVVEKECGMSSAKLWMLWEIFNNPGLKVSELADALVIHASTCSNLLDKLQDAGLVRRDRTGRDQRTVRVFLTDKGTQLLATAPRPAQGLLSEGLDRLPGDYLQELDHGLAKLVFMLESISSEAGMMMMTEK